MANQDVVPLDEYQLQPQTTFSILMSFTPPSAVQKACDKILVVHLEIQQRSYAISLCSPPLSSPVGLLESFQSSPDAFSCVSYESNSLVLSHELALRKFSFVTRFFGLGLADCSLPVRFAI